MDMQLCICSRCLIRYAEQLNKPIIFLQVLVRSQATRPLLEQRKRVVPLLSYHIKPARCRLPHTFLPTLVLLGTHQPCPHCPPCPLQPRSFTIQPPSPPHNSCCHSTSRGTGSWRCLPSASSIAFATTLRGRRHSCVVSTKSPLTRPRTLRRQSWKRCGGIEVEAGWGGGEVFLMEREARERERERG